MSDEDSSPELLHHTFGNLFWGFVFLAVYGVGLLVKAGWPAVGPYGDTLLLVALGIACVINFGRNRTLHCGLTGPLFLLAAVVAALVEAGSWSTNMSVLWGVVLAGVAVAFIVEWRVAGRPRSAS